MGVGVGGPPWGASVDRVRGSAPRPLLTADSAVTERCLVAVWRSSFQMSSPPV